MPNLRAGDKMHTCESPYCGQTTGGSRAGKPRPFVVQKYKEDIERYWCDTCCRIGLRYGSIKSVYRNGSWYGYIAIMGLALETVRKHLND